MFVCLCCLVCHLGFCYLLTEPGLDFLAVSICFNCRLHKNKCNTVRSYVYRRTTARCSSESCCHSENIVTQIKMASVKGKTCTDHIMELVEWTTCCWWCWHYLMSFKEFYLVHFSCFWGGQACCLPLLLVFMLS